MSKGRSNLNSSRQSLWSIILFTLITALYISSLSFGFVLDDAIHIVENPVIRNPEGWLDILFAGYFPGNLYRPLVLLSYALTYKFIGLEPYFYHLTNILLHAAVTTVFYLILSQIIQPRIAMIIAIIFGVHPLSIEVVANISGRAESLAALFSLLTLHGIWTISRDETTSLKPGYWIFTPIFFLLALMSKESAFTVLLLAPLGIAGVYREKLLSGKFLGSYLTLLASSGVYLLLRVLALGSFAGSSAALNTFDNPIAGISAPYRIYNAILILADYAAYIVIPVGIGRDHSFAEHLPVYTLGGAEALKIILIGVVLLGGLIGLRKRSKAALFLLWYLVSFSITSNVLFPIGTVFGERLTYMPAMGLISALVIVFQRFHVTELRKLFPVVWGVFLVLATSEALPIWKDSLSLFSHQVKVSPNSAKAQHNLGVALANRGDNENARKHIARALDINNDYPDASYSMAALYFNMGKNNRAEVWLNLALKQDPLHLRALTKKGRLLFNRKELKQADQLFDKALAQRKNHVPALVGKLAIAIERDSKKEIVRLIGILKKVAAEDSEFRKLLSDSGLNNVD